MSSALATRIPQHFCHLNSQHLTNIEVACVFMGLEIIFTYAKLVVLLMGRMVEKMFRIGTIQVATVTQHVLGLPCVDLPNGDQQLTEWVSTSDEDQWEIGGRDLLEEKDKQSHEISYSSIEDELIELSDGEERPTSITSLLSGQQSRFISSSSAKMISSDSSTLLL
ncbi:unnamed protein product [Peronospora farinosa]|uniref:Uncharacterized protein n=1 Tax=Peronospora farinosa TaxID=134698 RepID=A0AAV0THZ1_9STRA|nr:unnamed protein product [Peronospora farinosa]